MPRPLVGAARTVAGPPQTVRPPRAAVWKAVWSAFHNGAMSNPAKDARAPDEASRQDELQAGDDGVAVTGGSTGPDPDVVVIPWGQAVAVARRIIELARARGDLT
jgi:hypothetical protein